jgi:acyl dehydratase
MSHHDPDAPDVGDRVLDAVTGVTDGWVSASGHLTNSVVEANRAALAAFGLAGAGVSPGVDSVAYQRADWSTERSVAAPDGTHVGDTVRFSKRVTDADVAAFADASGDTNRLHLDDDFAERTRFGRRIAHGTLVAGLLSAALARLPGVTIYLSQDLRFTAPVGVGDRLTAVVEVTEELGGGRYRLDTDVVDDDGEACVTGEAVVVVDSFPEE